MSEITGTTYSCKYSSTVRPECDLFGMPNHSESICTAERCSPAKLRSAR